MSPAVSIRRASPGDLPAVMGMERAAFGDDSFTLRQLRYLITRARGAFFVAEYEGAPAGYISVLASARHRHARIYSLVVDSARRGRGIAEAMLDMALDFARSEGLKSVFLEVRPDNLAAIALYKKKGFVRRLVKPDYYHDHTPADSMVLRF